MLNKRYFLSIVVLLVLIASTSLFLARQQSANEPMPVAEATPVAEVQSAPSPLTSLPVTFVENKGQWPVAVKFKANTGGMEVFIKEQGWIFTLKESSCSPRNKKRFRRQQQHQQKKTARRAVAVDMRFTGHRSLPTLAVAAPLPGVHNFYLGNDPSRWQTGVKGYDTVNYKGMYPGIDVRVKECSGRLEYDLVLAPGADLGLVDVKVTGATGLRLAADGSLIIDTALGSIRQAAPRTWEVTGENQQRPVKCRYRILGPDSFGFIAPIWQGNFPLIIDPVLEYSTYLGSSASEFSYGIKTDMTGTATVVGEVDGTGFPTTTGAYDITFNGSSDAFVTRVDRTGTKLIFSTYLGSTGGDYAAAVTLDSNGEAIVVGETDTSTFPVTAGAYDSTFNGVSGSSSDIFVTRLDNAGGKVVYSTFVGGSLDEFPGSVAVDKLGQPTFTGQTDSTDYPTSTGAFSTTYAGQGDAFITRLDRAGAKLVYSTYVGGSGSDGSCGVGVDARGYAFIGGATSSTNFPTTTGAFDTTYNGGNSDFFVTCVDNTATKLVYSTFIGGTSDDYGYTLGVDMAGRATVVGETDSSDFPTTVGAFDTTYNGSSFNTYDAGVTCLDITGKKLVFSTYLGGSGDEYVYSVAVDILGHVVVSGDTDSSDFPTTPGAWDRAVNPIYTGYFTRFDLTGKMLLYSTFLGGTGGDSIWSVTTDIPGFITTLSDADSTDFPTTTGAFDVTQNGLTDVAVTRIRTEFAGVNRFGNSTPACLGQIPGYVLEPPTAGEQNFGIACTHAPPSSSGLLLIGLGRLGTGWNILGIDLWLDFTKATFAFGVLTDSKGEGSLPLPLPASAAGANFFSQFILLNTASCGGAGTLSSSDGLSIKVY